MQSNSSYRKTTHFCFFIISTNVKCHYKIKRTVNLLWTKFHVRSFLVNNCRNIQISNYHKQKMCKMLQAAKETQIQMSKLSLL